MNMKSSDKRFVSFALVSILLLTTFLLTFSVNVFAAGSSAGGNSKFFPYYITSDSLDPITIQNYIDDEYAWWGFVPFDFSYDRIIAWNYTENGTDYICFLGFNYSSYSFSTYPTDFDPLTDHITISINNCDIYYAFKDYGWSGQKSYGYWNDVQTSERFFQGGVNDFFYLKSPLYYPSENVPDFTPSTSNMIFTNTQITVPIPPHGNVTPPHESNDYNHGHGITNGNGNKPTLPPSPTINNYSWTTYTSPSIDTSSLEGLVQGLIDTVSSYFSWLATNIGGLFSNLISNISDFVTFIGNLILYVGREIQDSVHDFLYFIYANLVSLLDPFFTYVVTFLTEIYEFFTYLNSLMLDENGNLSFVVLFENLFIPSESDLQNAFEDSDTFNLFGTFGIVFTKVQSIFTGITNLTPTKIIHVPSLVYHGYQIGDFDINFNWYDNYKALGDGIISAFLIFNYIWFIFFRLPSFIRGSSGNFNYDSEALVRANKES